MAIARSASNATICACIDATVVVAPARLLSSVSIRVRSCSSSFCAANASSTIGARPSRDWRSLPSAIWILPTRRVTV